MVFYCLVSKYLIGVYMRDYMFAGSFYPKPKKELEGLIKSYFERSVPDFGAKAKSMIVPHAGYIYSGQTAALAYKSVSTGKQNFDSVIIIGPNHTGLGDPVGISAEDWSTPMGKVRNDKDFGMEIISSSRLASADELSHSEEHSIEVQLPFIQYAFADIPIVPICMGDQSIDACKDLHEAITKAESKLKRHPFVIASSDFNHYESEHVASSKDIPLLKMLEGLRAEEFNENVIISEDSACGYGPSTVAALYAKAHGAKRGELLEYTNSGSKTGDMSSVVAYASMVFV